MSLQTTAPPRRASSTANAAPIPLPAPVTTARALWLTLFDLCSNPSIPYPTFPAASVDERACPRGEPARICRRSVGSTVVRFSQQAMVTLVNGNVLATTTTAVEILIVVTSRSRIRYQGENLISRARWLLLGI